MVGQYSANLLVMVMKIHSLDIKLVVTQQSSKNTFMGYQSGYGQGSAPYASGNGNVGVGYRTLIALTTVGEIRLVMLQEIPLLPQEDIMLR